MYIIRVDLQNFLAKERAIKLKTDAPLMVAHFCRKVAENPGYVFEFETDKDGRLTNAFSISPDAILLYKSFGDVVVFDTTYALNHFKLPFAPFVGVDINGLTIQFGCGLLQHETAESFRWLFTCFLRAEEGKAPRTILTDKDAAMANGIAAVLPETKHAVCMWHLARKFAEKFGYKLGDQFHYFLKDFYEARRTSCPRQMEAKWSMLFDRIVKSRREARVKANYERKMRTIENHPYPLMAHGYKCFSTYAFRKFEKEVTESLAYVIYEVTTIDFENLITTSRVRHHNQDGSAGNGRVVTYQAPEQVVSCDCNEFSFSGILCKHALRVLLRHNVTAIPERYILKLWRWDTLLFDNEGSTEVGPAVSTEVSAAVRDQVSDNIAEVAGVVSEGAQAAATAVSITVAEEGSTPAPAAEFADFQHHVQHLLPFPPVVRKPAAVRTKGRPRNASRIPSGVQASMAALHKKRRRCGLCREY
ncbi:hypothetical protein PsorP6_016800 [Peronosclerospora sorghi]|uniref:Uncharacterized protein n=1 Tax=Peronosclerospora sorghi TaxID=230839 RepID=A0ACC0WCF0_9STRA|nr:hypothetical protein PsorP6_016800 [Peronosclerospora sorghi]